MSQRLVYVFLLLFAITPNTGFYTFNGFLLLTIAVLLIIISSVFSINVHIPKSTDRNAITIASVAIIAYSVSYYGGFYQYPSTIFAGMLGIGLSLILLLYSFTKNITGLTKMFIILIFIYIGVATWTIISSPRPIVDVFVLLQEAPRKLLEGINPYATTYTQVYPKIINDTFAYLPMSIVLFIPSIIVFNDPRYTIVVAMVIFSLFIHRALIGKAAIPLMSIATAILFIPKSFFLLEHAYVEPLIAIGFFFSYQLWKNGIPSWSLLILSASMLLKLDTFISFPAFIPMAKNLYKNSHIKYYWVIPILITLLFVIRSPDDFMRNILNSYTFGGSFDMSTLISTQKTLGVPINNSLSLPSWMTRITGADLNNVMLYVPILIALVISIIIFCRPIKLFSKIWIVHLILHYVYPHSFYNHYYFIVLMILLDITDDLIPRHINTSYAKTRT